MTSATTSTSTIDTATTHFDVLIVGAGISGIGAAYHLKSRFPDKTFAILEGRDAIGGTWDMFRYPGMRSDSDMPTFGFGFKPWTNKRSIAPAEVIRDYLGETVAENSLDEHIRFGHHVVGADFSTQEGEWTVTARVAGSDETVQLTAQFLYSGTGYYDYGAGYTPELAGLEDFAGPVVHPQFWPEDLDYTGKHVVVIGSGATAVTLIPAMADKAAHITMLQRSPSYVLALPAVDVIANALNRVLGPRRAYPLIRRKNLFLHRGIYKFSRRSPKLLRRALMADARRRLPKGYDVETHFNPPYNPWDQRLCMVPDGDFFETVASGRASIVTDRIDRITPTGISLESGQVIDADIIITATGLNIMPLGGIDLAVDGEVVDLAETTVYKSMMLSGVPNFAFAIGYTNISWTLKVDVICEHFCRLLEHMDAEGQKVMVPVLGDPEMERLPLLDLTSGYVKRGIGRFPKAGTSGPWTVEMAYEKDVERLVEGPVEDPELHFTGERALAAAA